MADLRVENPKTTEEFAAWLKALGRPLPWDIVLAVPDDSGALIVDANGDVVMEIYSDELDGIEHTNGVAAAVLVAVLTCGGFRAVAATADASK